MKKPWTNRIVNLMVKHDKDGSCGVRVFHSGPMPSKRFKNWGGLPRTVSLYLPRDAGRHAQLFFPTKNDWTHLSIFGGQDRLFIKSNRIETLVN